MAFESWDDAMFWHGSLIGYMAGVKSACKDEDKSSLLLKMADTQARLEFMESENAKLRELLGNVGNILFSLDVDYCGACKADNVSHPCPVYTVKGGECLYKTAMRELGVEE